MYTCTYIFINTYTFQCTYILIHICTYTHACIVNSFKFIPKLTEVSLMDHTYDPLPEANAIDAFNVSTFSLLNLPIIDWEVIRTKGFNMD
jgi:hypothetical protein